MFTRKKERKICFSIEELYEINEKWRMLKNEVIELKEENILLKKEIEELKNELIKRDKIIEDYEKDEPFFLKIEELKKKIKILETENSSLKQKYSFLYKVNTSLFSLLYELEKQNRNLIEKLSLNKIRYELDNRKYEVKLQEILLKVSSLKEELEKNSLSQAEESTTSSTKLKFSNNHKKNRKKWINLIDIKV